MNLLNGVDHIAKSRIVKFWVPKTPRVPKGPWLPKVPKVPRAHGSPKFHGSPGPRPMGPVGPMRTNGARQVPASCPPVLAKKQPKNMKFKQKFENSRN